VPDVALGHVLVHDAAVAAACAVVAAVDCVVHAAVASAVQVLRHLFAALHHYPAALRLHYRQLVFGLAYVEQLY